MSAITPAQAHCLLGLVNRATGRRYRTLPQAARNFGLSGGAVARITGDQAAALIDEWSARPEYVKPWSADPAAGPGATGGDGPLTTEQAAAMLGHEVVVTTAATPDGINLIPDGIVVLDDGRPALRARVALADVTSWSRV
jgi:hypothetical protein